MYMLSIWLGFSSCFCEVISMTCGIDNSTVSQVYEGVAKLETYPWLGVLYYPHGKKKFTTAVVLVTRQIVLAAANEIDKLPKKDFRSRARVVLGRNCDGPYIGVRDYTYHSDYKKETYSTLAMIQLETDHVKIELRPICPPPSHFRDENFFAMVLSDSCKKLKLRIHKMKYVSPEQCKAYYRRSGLGFGVYGPGCQAPARFLDYGMYHEWVRRSVARIGRPAITSLADNHVVLRRKLSNVQRFGPCDNEEINRELYSSTMALEPTNGFIRYNVTLISDVEYSCVVFKATSNDVTENLPKIRLRRWYAGTTAVCPSFGFLEIQFYVEIKFTQKVDFYVRAYGDDVKFIDPAKISVYLKRGFPKIETYPKTKEKYNKLMNDKSYFAFG